MHKESILPCLQVILSIGNFTILATVERIISKNLTSRMSKFAWSYTQNHLICCFVLFHCSHKKDAEFATTNEGHGSPDKRKKVGNAGSLTTEESHDSGAIPWSIYLSYIHSAGGILAVLAVLLFFAINVSSIGESCFISYLNLEFNISFENSLECVVACSLVELWRWGKIFVVVLALKLLTIHFSLVHKQYIWKRNGDF